MALTNLRELQMKKISTKFKFLSILIVLSVLQAPSVWAHDYIGALGALSGAGATDLLRVDCAFDPTAGSQQATKKLAIALQDGTAGGGIVSVEATTGNQATTVTDNIAGDGLATPYKYLTLTTAVQNVSFIVLINHTAAGAKDYVASLHCQDVSGQHTGTTINVLQNQ